MRLTHTLTRAKANKKYHFHHSGTSADHIKLTTPHNNTHTHREREREEQQRDQHTFTYMHPPLYGYGPLYTMRCDAMYSRALQSTARTHCHRITMTTTTSSTRRTTLWGRTFAQAKSSTLVAAPHRHWLHYKMVAIVDLCCCLFGWPCHV